MFKMQTVYIFLLISYRILFFKVIVIIMNILKEIINSLGKVTLATYLCKRLDIFKNWNPGGGEI